MQPEHIYLGEWVISGDGLLRQHGGVAVGNNRIQALGPARELIRHFPDAGITDLGTSILLPGLVNAHTHLSLTQLPDPPPKGSPFFTGLRQIAVGAGGLTETDVQNAVRAGIDASLALGTVAVGEITTRPEGVSELAGEPRLASRVFFEFLGVQESVARDRFAQAVKRARDLDQTTKTHIRPGLSPHAPYSVWPDLWEETHRLSRDTDFFWSTHLGEAPEEDRFMRDGQGRIVDYLNSWGVWDGTFPVPGQSAVEFLSARGVLDGRALLVHGVHLTPAEMSHLARSGSRLCLCPRSNAYLDLPPPPVSHLLEQNVPLCLGTDSLGSNDDLSVWAEMREVHALVPDLPAQVILDMATRVGAEALGLEDQAGTLGVGLPFRAVSVKTNGLAKEDVYEFLVRERVEDRVQLLG